MFLTLTTISGIDYRVLRGDDLLQSSEAAQGPMNYSRRIQIAAILSLLLHLAALALWHYQPRPAPTPVVLKPAPIEIDLQPDAPSPRERVQLVDVATPSPEMTPPSPLIAEENAEAMDDAPDDGNAPSPDLAPDQFDQLAAAPSPAAEPQPRPTPPVEEESEEETEETEEKAAEAEKNSAPEYSDMESSMEGILTPAEDHEKVAQAEEKIIKIARADATLPQRPSPERSSVQNNYAREGATNFQAIQSQIAPYLKQVRAQVEREWNEMLYTRYSGSSPVKAVIDCAISPEGNLVSVTVVGTDNDQLYSSLCQDAVKRAGPFGAFPFQVPDIYRDKNLEIRWTFSFL